MTKPNEKNAVNSFEKLRDELANTQAKGKFLGDQLRLTFIDGFQSGFDKGAEEMAKIKDVQILELGTALESIVGCEADLFGDDIVKALENFRKEGPNGPEVK